MKRIHFISLSLLLLNLASCNKDAEKLERDKQLQYEKSNKLGKEATNKFFQNDFASAERLFNEAIEADRDNSKAYMNRAYFEKEHNKNYLKSISDYSHAIDILTLEKRTDSDLWFSYLERGECKQLLNDDRGAIQDFDKAISQKPMFSLPFLLRGTSKYNLKDVNGACSDWSKAGELGESEAYNHIAKYCR